MRILRNYFLKEFIGPLFLSFFVLTFVMLLGNLIKIAELIINKGVDIYIVGKLFLYMIPSLLIYILPISTLVAILLSMGRLSSDNEIVTIKASGIGLSHLIIPQLIVGLLISLCMVIINDRIIPYAHFETRKTLMQVGIKNPAAVLEPGVFINSFEKYKLFIYSIEENRLHNIRIYESQGENKPARIIAAKRGEFIVDPEKNIVKLKLMDGTTDEPDPDNPKIFYKLNFKTYFMNLAMASQDTSKIEKKPKDMTIHELEAAILDLKKQGIKDTSLLVAEIHKKISLAFSSFVFILLGLPLAIITRRREKSINFSIAFIVVMIYYLMLLGTEAMAREGYLAPAIAFWTPNVIFGTIGAILTFRLCVY